MARPRKKRAYRPILVSGLRFRWCHKFWNRPYCLVVVLEAERSARGQRLIVERCRGTWPEGDTPPLDISIFKAVHRAREREANEEATPAFVAAVIQFALKHGWEPRENGRDFTIRYYEDGLADVVS
jgi:hypothetical protein